MKVEAVIVIEDDDKGEDEIFLGGCSYSLKSCNCTTVPGLALAV
jgi:hypothetical protein